MITSMTGFASATHEAESATTSVTVKSVNHRFLDVQLRVPSTLAAAENALRTQIQQRLARGRVEVTIAVQTRRVTTPDRRARRGVRGAARARRSSGPGRSAW